MRISAFSVRNYKGIAHASIGDLEHESVITISGRNGTGKSLLLEALVAAWSGRYDLNPRVGPWSSSLCIDVSVHLAHEEWEVLDRWSERMFGEAASREDDLRYRVVAGAQPEEQPFDNRNMQVLRSPDFQRTHRFSVIDFLPANRLVPSVPTPSVDLGMLGIDRVDQERVQMLDQVIQTRAAMSLPSVANYLVTLDYQNYLATRQGLDLPDEYSTLAGAFGSATGKSLLLPEYDPNSGSNIEVALQSGHRHGLSDLSSGEQEMLAMMYFVRRLSASGGVLCIDEPEQHLHPTLQAALFESMQNLADRAQVLVVSHSVNLISAAPLSGLLQVSAASNLSQNQIGRLPDFPNKMELVAALGVTPADLFQNDILVVVEGDTDAQWLRALYPVEMGRAHIMIAGSGGQVIDAHETLAKINAGVPWLGLRDRDLLSDEELEEMRSKYPNLFVWPRRAFESMLLDLGLIHGVAKSLDLKTDRRDLESLLFAESQKLKDEVLLQLVEKELASQFPPPEARGNGGKFEKMKHQLEDYSIVNLNRANALDQVRQEQSAKLDQHWDRDYLTVVNPKSLMAILTTKLGVFKSASILISALVARARDDEQLRPPALEELRQRILSTITGE